MSVPKEDAAALELRAKPPRVPRLSRTGLATLIGAASLSILVATLWALRPPTLRDFVPAELHNVERSQQPEGIERLPRDYASVPRQPPQLGAPLPGELGKPVADAERAAAIPALPAASNFRPAPAEDAARVAHLEAVREANAAAKADVLFRLRKSEDGKPVWPKETQQSQAASVPLDTAPPSVASGPDHRHLLANTGNDRTTASSARLERPASSETLLAGTIISAALVTGINSDVPGQAIAVITEDVRDSVAGTRVLVPQGARLMGRYDSQTAFGQRRLALTWSRLVRPDGSSIVLDKLPAADSTGLAGLADEVDRHWSELFVGAALSTMIGIGAELAAPDIRSDERVVVATRQSLQDSVNQFGQQFARRGLDVHPTLKIRPGYPLRVIVNHDLQFEGP